MTILCLGLIVFLGCHSIRIVGEDWRRRQLARLGEMRWKAMYSVLSALGLGFIVWGYGLARAEPVLLWAPPAWARHTAALLTLPAFILIAAAYVPGNRLRARLGHPMVLGVKLWALAHLLANGHLADLVLFGSFLAWAIANFRAARARDRVKGTIRPPGTTTGDLLTTIAGSAVWASFAFFLHQHWIGVRPF